MDTISVAAATILTGPSAGAGFVDVS